MSVLDCGFNCHQRCEDLVPRDCPGDKRGINGGAGAPRRPGRLPSNRYMVRQCPSRTGLTCAYVIFPESPLAAGSSPEPGDDESELTSMTELDISGDEMSVDGDSNADGSDSEWPRETMRSGQFNMVMSYCKCVQVTSSGRPSS